MPQQLLYHVARPLDMATAFMQRQGELFLKTSNMNYRGSLQMEEAKRGRWRVTKVTA